MGDFDDPRFPHRRRQWHLVYSGRLVDKVHRPVNVRAAVNGHGQVGKIAVVTTPDVYGPLQDDRRVIEPMSHSVLDGHALIWHIDAPVTRISRQHGSSCAQ